MIIFYLTNIIVWGAILYFVILAYKKFFASTSSKEGHFDVQVIKGIVKTIGDAVVLDDDEVGEHTYSYIEMSDGQIIKNFCTLTGLNGMLFPALAKAKNVEMHIVEGEKNLLIAFKEDDGQLFAQDFGGDSPAFLKVIQLVLFILGIPLIAAFGYGLVIMGKAYLWYSNDKARIKLRDYVGSLPNPILI